MMHERTTGRACCFTLIFILALFLLVPVAVTAAFAPYDDFSMTRIDEGRWSAYESGRFIQDGTARLGVRSSRFSRIPAMSSLDFRNPESVYAIEVRVTFMGWHNPDGAGVALAAGGRFFNDGTGSSGAYLGDIRADVRIGGGGTSPVAAWAVNRHTGTTDPGPTTVIASGNFSKIPEVGKTYTLYVRWDGVKFTFRFDGEEKTYSPPGTIAEAKKPYKQVYARVANNSGKEAGVKGFFDDVRINDEAALYDDFSGPVIDSAKWMAYELVRLPVDGRLWLKARTGPGSMAPLTEALDIIGPADMQGMEGKITPLVLQSLGDADVSARLQGGWFFNDGTAGRGYVGDVRCAVGIESRQGGAPRAFWSVEKGTDAANPDLLAVSASGFFGKTIAPGETYRVSYRWDGIRFVFRFDDEEAVYEPASEVHPPKSPAFLGAAVRINQGEGIDATAEALFDDVMVEYLLVDLPRTGQTKCYDAKGAEITCAGTGQDGEFQSGLLWPVPRFRLTYCSSVGPCVEQDADCDGNAANDIMTDLLTGLVWPRSVDLLTGTVDWGDALHYANSLSLCGLGSWRLPNINQLESLFHAGEPDTAQWLAAQGFGKVEPQRYWTSTTLAGDDSQALDFNIGDGSIYYNGKSLTDRHVFPVREWGRIWAVSPVWRTGQDASYGSGDDGDEQSGVPWPTPRFIDVGDCVIDNLTGLMWAKNGALAGVTLNWEDALAYAGSLSLCGYTDWHLPNRREMRSLVDHSQFSPALPSGHPFISILTDYWTSTTAGSKDSAWVVTAAKGTLSVPAADKDMTYGVWPVRDALSGPMPDKAALAVNRSGSGTVVSSPAGIACGADCYEEFPQGTMVTLTAVPEPGSVFLGWKGGGCSGTGQCEIEMNSTAAITTVWAGFVSEKTRKVNLTVTKTKKNRGDGTVTSADGKVTCGKDCKDSYYPGSPVILEALPAPGSVFAGWDGCPLPSGYTCSITVEAATRVKASFVGPSLLRVAISSRNGGAGTIASTPDGINCGSGGGVCSRAYAYLTKVTLAAKPAEGSSFVSWTGCPSASGVACAVTMDKARTVKAAFEKPKATGGRI